MISSLVKSYVTPTQKAFEQEESNKTKGLSLSITCGGLKGGFLLQEKNACIHF